MDKRILSEIDLFLLDMDGTLYLGDRLFDCTLPFLNAVRQAGKRYLFMTNNSSHSVADYVKKLEHLGIPAKEEDFVTSSQATVRYLKEHYPEARLYVCGTKSLQKELSDAGFTVTTDLEKTDCIVMGFDTELTFGKLRDVSYLLSTRDLPYIATNPDYVCPTEFGSVPDCGSVCDMIFNTTGKRPFVIGKPHICNRQHRIDGGGRRIKRSIEASMKSCRLERLEEFRRPFPEEERFAARKRDASTRLVIESLILERFGDDLVDGHRFAVELEGTRGARHFVHRAFFVILAKVLEPRPLRLTLDGFRIVAPDALQWTALYEERRAHSRPVPYRHALRVKHQRRLDRAPCDSCRRDEAGPCRRKCG